MFKISINIQPESPIISKKPMTGKHIYSTKTYIWNILYFQAPGNSAYAKQPSSKKQHIYILHQEKLQEKWPGIKIIMVVPLICNVSPNVACDGKKKHTQSLLTLKGLTALNMTQITIFNLGVKSHCHHHRLPRVVHSAILFLNVLKHF